jgi:hypothetical protein
VPDFEVHVEEFLNLAGLGHDKALISLGGFYEGVRLALPNDVTRKAAESVAAPLGRRRLTVSRPEGVAA